MAERTRARPLLGTRVTIRAAGLNEDAADRAIEAAFAEIERAQKLMSFHDPDSELSRVNREAARGPVQVEPLTFGVLRRALRIARESGGRFDPVVGRELVEGGVLPAPADGFALEGEDPARKDPADWRDVMLLDGRRVQFRRPLWIDLGGIGKGWAVDRAVAALRWAGTTRGCVNAGGDLRVFGPEAEQVLLRPATEEGGDVPVMLLERAALASSAGQSAGDGPERSGLVLDGRRRRPAQKGRSVSVVARSAWLADALTKVLIAAPRAGERVLRRYGALGWVHSAEEGWRACAS